MTIATFQTWVKTGKPYLQGVILFKELSNNEALVELFQSDDDEYNRELLYKELSKLVTKSPVQPAQKSDDFKSVSEINIEKWDTKNFDQDSKNLVIRAGELTKKIDHYRSQLELLDSKQKRFETAEIIVSSAKERQSIYNRLDYFQQHGKFPDEPADKPVKEISDRALLAITYKNLASRICKAKQKNQTEKVKDLESQRQMIKEVLNL